MRKIMGRTAKLLSSLAVIFVTFIPMYLDILGWIFLQPEIFYQKLILIIVFICISPIQLLFLIIGISALFAIND